MRKWSLSKKHQFIYFKIGIKNNLKPLRGEGLPFMRPALPQKAAAHFSLLPLIFLVLLLFPIPASGTENEGWPLSILKFAGGLASGALIHEGGHALVAGVSGTHLTWEVGTYNQPIGFTDHAESDAKGVALYSAGFIAQATGAEIILQVDGIDKNENYVRGMMAWNVVNPILYSLDYWVFHRTNKKNGNSYQGDLQGIEHYSNQTTANVFAASFSAIALFQGYRFLKTQTWAPDWLKGESYRFGFILFRSGGLLMTYDLRF
jgi:hypothetical protein